MIPKHEEEIRRILALEDDFDGEGSPKYNETTIERAKSNIPKILELMQGKLPITLEALAICPGPKSSIDLHWKTSGYELLANVPTQGSATYYGDNYKDKKLEGILD